MELNGLNVLPAPTWRELDLNDTKLEGIEIPQGPYTKAILQSALPDTVDTDIPALPEIATGMGRIAADFVAAHNNSGFRLHAKTGTTAIEPIHFSWHLEGENAVLVDDNAIYAEEGSTINVLAVYEGNPSQGGFHGGRTRIYAAKNAKVHYIIVQLLGDKAVHFSDIGIHAEAGAQVSVIQAELGAAKAYTGCKSLLAAKDSTLNLESVLFGDGSREFDVNYVAVHEGQKTNSKITINTALLDESKHNLRGTIDFISGAKGAVGHESVYALLFSPKVRNKTAPLILCGEEEVEGQHAATIGKIDDDTLFYLMSRGIDEMTAKKLLIEAHFQPVLDKIPDTELQNKISDYIRGRLGAIESISK